MISEVLKSNSTLTTLDLMGDEKEETVYYWMWCRNKQYKEK